MLRACGAFWQLAYLVVDHVVWIVAFGAVCTICQRSLTVFLIKLEIVVSFQIVVGIAALVDVRIVEFLQLEVWVFAPVLGS